MPLTPTPKIVPMADTPPKIIPAISTTKPLTTGSRCPWPIVSATTSPDRLGLASNTQLLIAG